MVADTDTPSIAELARTGELAQMRGRYTTDLDLYRAVSGRPDVRSAPGSFRVALVESQAILRDLRFRRPMQEHADFGNSGPNFSRFDGDATIDEVQERYLTITTVEERALDIPITLTDGPVYNCVNASDIHYGPRACAYAKWLKLLDWILDEPDTGLIVNGDIFNEATKTAPGMGPSDDALPFDKQRDLAAHDLAPLADAGKLHALLSGNHDQRAAKASGVKVDPVGDLAKSLGVPHLGYEGFVRWRIEGDDDAQIYTGYHHHGFGGGRKRGGKVNKIHDTAHVARTDYVVMGHTHDLFADNVTYREVLPDGRIDTRRTVVLYDGSYYDMMAGGYSADQGLPPPLIGSGTIWLHGDKHSVHART